MTDENTVQTLSEKFEKALNIHLDLQKASESSNSPTFQKKVQKAISLLEDATSMVNELDLFSRNEEFEEISTVDLKYLLLPALLGNLTSRLVTSDRLHLVETSEVYYKDYLTRLGDYGMCNVALPRDDEDPPSGEATGERVVPPNDSLSSLEAMARKRRAKIERYSRQKELEESRKVLKDKMDSGSAEDETVREYYSTLLRFWVNSALEELESIKLEKDILKHMAQLKLEGKELKKEPPKSKPIKPVIITRNELQKKVIGVGYPSIPVLTVDEFYEQRYGGHEKEHSGPAALSLQKMAEDPDQTAREIEEEDAEKEEKLEREDPVTMIRWQLTRRFFLVDPVSGREVGEEPAAAAAKVLRFAQSISLRIRVRDEEEADVGAIYPPLLVVGYSEVTREELLRHTPVQTVFDVSYEMAQSKTFYSIHVAVSVLSVLALGLSCFQCWSWSRRAGKANPDIQVLGKLLVFSSGNLANAFFLVVLCASVNWLVVFKRQDVVHLLLPSPAQEEPLVIYISAAFALKCLQIIHMLVSQSTTDVFFIDWERPRSSSLRGLATRRTSVRLVDETAAQVGEGGNSVPGIGSGKQPPSEKSLDPGGGVSIWRTYFVSSTWADLQTLRRVRPGVQLFLLLSFLQVFGFENVSLADPGSGLSGPGECAAGIPFSITCRFAIAASLFLTIAFVQYMIHRVAYERFFEDRLQQFIDLCSVSNISVFAMSLPRYGYYIHGRSAHGRADVNMKEMHEHLRREEEDLCGHRGLLPNTEQQTFCMALPEGLWDQYKRLLLPLTSYSQTADRMQGVGGRLARVDVERVVCTYQMVNKFLSGFIEHAFKDLDYAVKDHLLLENLLDVEFTRVEEKGFFYNDNSHSFDTLMFCGQESSLVVFECLLFCVVDLASQDLTLAATLTYLFYKVIEAARKSAGRRNLVRKALVDERFLNT